MERVALDLGFIKIYWYSIMIMFGVIGGGSLTYFEAKRLKIDIDYYFNMIFYTIVFAFVGARLYYVLFNLNYYLKNLSEIIAVWNGGLAIHGGIIGGSLTIILYSLKNKRKTNEILKYMDITSLGIIVGQIIGRWGNFFNQEAHGGITTINFLKSLHIPNFIIEGMTINGITYHPTFLYESLLNFIGLIILLIVRHNKKIKSGMIVSIYLIWYSSIRIFIESMRTDSLMLFNLKMAQVISIFLIIFGIILFIYSLKHNDYYNKERGN